MNPPCRPKGQGWKPPPTAGAPALYPDLRLKENALSSDTYPTQSGTARVPRMGECATSSTLGRSLSERRTGCAKERLSGSVRGAPGRPVSLPRSPAIVMTVLESWQKRWGSGVRRLSGQQIGGGAWAEVLFDRTLDGQIAGEDNRLVFPRRRALSGNTKLSLAADRCSANSFSSL